MKQYFLKLYQYNAWANKRVINCLSRQTVGDEKILNIMGHIVAAQFLWLHRIKGLPPADVKLWGEYSLVQVTTMAEEAGKLWLEFVESTDNFNRELTYNNYLGEPYINNVEMIMIHLVNHSSYHRAQIALLLRQKGYEPINTDFITYDRVITGQWKD
ncbi:MAG TPA: DinB family protein [Chryseolinea sp.]|nr:DinB family protein [Chryseolinea sp.]